MIIGDLGQGTFRIFDLERNVLDKPINGFRMKSLVELGQIYMVEVCPQVCEGSLPRHHTHLELTCNSRRDALKVGEGVFQICMKLLFTIIRTCERSFEAYLESFQCIEQLLRFFFTTMKVNIAAH